MIRPKILQNNNTKINSSLKVRLAMKQFIRDNGRNPTWDEYTIIMFKIYRPYMVESLFNPSPLWECLIGKEGEK